MNIGVAAFIFLAASSLESGWLHLIGGYRFYPGSISPSVLLLNSFVSLGLFAAAAAFLFSVLGSGAWIDAWLFRVGRRGWRIRGLALGIMGASLAVLGLGLAGLLFRPLLVSLVLSMLACVQWGRIKAPKDLAWKDFAPALLLLPVLPDFIVAPLLPPVNVDMLVYHLGVPELWRMAHRIYGYPGNMTFSYPMGLERLFLPLQACGVAGANNWMHALLLVLASGLAVKTVGEAGSPHGRAFGWLAFGSAASLSLALQGHQDLGLVFGVSLAVRAVVRGSLPDMVTACAILPFLKYTGLEYSAAFALAWLVAGAGRGRRLFAALALAWAVVPSLPWLARNWIETGNPLYPFFRHILPSLNWRDWNSGMLWLIMRNATVQPDFSGPLGAPGGWLSYFWRAGGSHWFSWHTALYCLVPLAFFWRRMPAAGRVLALQSLIFAAFFLVPSPKVGRYLLPGALVPLVLCALMVRDIPRRAVWGLVVLVLPLNALAVAGQARTGGVTPDEVLGGSVKPAGWWRISMGSVSGAIGFINRECAGPGRVLVIGEPSALGLNRPWLVTDDTNIPAWRLALGDSPEPGRMMARLRQSGIRWILYNPLRASRLSGWTEPSLADARWMRAWALAWKGGTRMLREPGRYDWTGGVYVYEVRQVGKAAPGPLPWLPGAERYLVQPADIEKGRAVSPALSAQYAVMGEFGVSSYTRMLVAEYRHNDHGLARREFRSAESLGFRAPFLYEAMAEVARREGRPCEALKWVERQAEAVEGEDQVISQARARLKEECQGGAGK